MRNCFHNDYATVISRYPYHSIVQFEYSYLLGHYNSPERHTLRTLHIYIYCIIFCCGFVQAFFLIYFRVTILGQPYARDGDNKVTMKNMGNLVARKHQETPHYHRKLKQTTIYMYIYTSAIVFISRNYFFTTINISPSLPFCKCTWCSYVMKCTRLNS